VIDETDADVLIHTVEVELHDEIVIGVIDELDEVHLVLLTDDVVIIEIDELVEVVEALIIQDIITLHDDTLMLVTDEMVEVDDVIVLPIIDIDEIVYDEHIDYIYEHLKYITIVYVLNDEMVEVVEMLIDVDVELIDEMYL